MNEETVFQAALQRNNPAERAAFLEKACQGNPALRSEVEGLLAAHERSGALDVPAVDLDATLIRRPGSENPGTTIGRYKLLQRIGEGGFGVVYMAEQTEPVRRRVALKIIKLGMDTKQVIGRFEAERQALAMMDHPNIAKVHDAGATESGRPFFVMELVKGIPITEYSDRENLTTQQRLELFVPVCHAIQHAHQKGVIHRDIKPTNVLVTLHDDRPVPKVIDFGIAKATEQRLTERTIFTEFQQFIGTPAYMSPEQAALSGLDIDTRSDVYSLGVLLYELLTGVPPFDMNRLRGVAYDEIRRIIHEEEPPRPSTRVSTLGDSLTDVAKRRKAEPSSLGRILRGDLDWIIMKAMEKDRTRRYETANGIVADIRRHLENEPVLAGPPRNVYKLRKFVRRNRGLVTGTVAVVGSLVIGLGIATYAFVAAEQESIRSQKVSQALNEMLATADSSMGKGADYTVRAMLDDFAATLDGRFDDDPRVEAALRHTIGRAYYYLGLPASSAPHLRRALELCEIAPQSRLVEARILTDLGQTLRADASLNGFDAAEHYVRKAIAIYRKEGEETAELANSYCILGWILNNKAWGLQIPVRENESVQLNREGIRILENQDDKRSLTVKGMMCTGLAWELLRSGDPNDLPEANDLAERGIQLLRANNSHSHFRPIAHAAHGLGQVQLGRPVEAERSFREAMRFDKRATGTVAWDILYALMSLMFQQGRFDEALELARTENQTWREPMPYMQVRSQSVVGRMLFGLGDYEGAEVQLRKALEDSLTHFDDMNLATLEAKLNLTQALASQDKSAKQRQAHELIIQLMPILRPETATGIEPYVHAFTLVVGLLPSPPASDTKLALDVNRRILDQPLVPLHRLRNLYTGARLKHHTGDPEGAIAFLQEVIESPAVYRWDPPVFPSDSPFFLLRNAEDLLARLWLESGDEAAAELIYRDAITRREEVDDPDRYQIIFAKQRLAMFLRELGKHEEAQDLLRAAQQALAGAPECFDWLKVRVEHDLAILSEPHTSNE